MLASNYKQEIGNVKRTSLFWIREHRWKRFKVYVKQKNLSYVEAQFVLGLVLSGFWI